jgi:hypothetical protein
VYVWFCKGILAFMDGSTYGIPGSGFARAYYCNTYHDCMTTFKSVPTCICGKISRTRDSASNWVAGKKQEEWYGYIVIVYCFEQHIMDVMNIPCILLVRHLRDKCQLRLRETSVSLIWSQEVVGDLRSRLATAQLTETAGTWGGKTSECGPSQH